MDSDFLFHEGELRDLYWGAMNPPVYHSANFRAKDLEHLRYKIQHEFREPFYTRGYNPTTAILQQKLAALEGTEDALLTGSGSAAIALAVLSVLKAGDHAVIPQKPYNWTAYLFRDFLSRFGISYTMVDPTEAKNYEAATQPNTRLYFLESPNSLTFEITDIRAVTALAKSKDIVTIIDNSYATPLYQKPALMGVDLVVHSATKYLSGHSDVVAGVICGKRKIMEPMFKGEFMVLGGILSPLESDALLKGLRTLEIRMEKISKNAAEIVKMLETHPNVEKVNYPFGETFPQRELAMSQMSACSGLLSIELKTGGFDGIARFTDHLKYFFKATSWGGYESLVFPLCVFRESLEQWDLPVPWNLVRLSVGIEPVEILTKDLHDALEQV